MLRGYADRMMRPEGGGDANPQGPFPYVFLANVAAKGLTDSDGRQRWVCRADQLHVPDDMPDAGEIRAAFAKGGWWILSTEDRNRFLRPGEPRIPG